MLMMACTPSSLRMGKAPEEEKTVDVVSVPQLPVPVLPVDSVSIPALIDNIANSQEVDSLIAEVNDSLAAHPEEVTAMVDSLTTAIDEVPVDTMIPANQQSAIKTKRDTTQMDSLELAIYKYNTTPWPATASTSAERMVSTPPWNMQPTTPLSTRLAPRAPSSMAVRQ